MPAQQQQRLTKRQRRVLRQQGILDQDNNFSHGFTVSSDISPMTDNQAVAFESWESGVNLMLHGIAGTGKTFLGLYFSLKEVMSKNTQYKKVFIVRSVVPTRDIGFLPGSQKDKMKVYEAPYYDIASKLFNSTPWLF